LKRQTDVYQSLGRICVVLPGCDGSLDEGKVRVDFGRIRDMPAGSRSVGGKTELAVQKSEVVKEIVQLFSSLDLKERRYD
jgi:hypothetical protein